MVKWQSATKLTATAMVPDVEICHFPGWCCRHEPVGTLPIYSSPTQALELNSLNWLKKAACCVAPAHSKRIPSFRKIQLMPVLSPWQRNSSLLPSPIAALICVIGHVDERLKECQKKTQPIWSRLIGFTANRRLFVLPGKH